MKGKLKRFLAGFLMLAILVTSAGISELFKNVGLDAEVTNITSNKFVGTFSDSIPQDKGIGCVYLWGSADPSSKDYNIEISSGLKSKQVVADGKDRHAGDGKMYFQINSNSSPAINRNWWLKVKNSGYMMQKGEIVPIDTKIYFGSDHKKGTGVEVGGSKPGHIAFATYRCLFNDSDKKSFISKKSFWGDDYSNNYFGLKENNLMLEFEFYKAGTSEKIENPAAVLYFTDIDTDEGWGMGYPTVNSSNKVYVHANSHLKTSKNVVDTEYRMFRGTETRKGDGLDSSAIGFSFRYNSSSGNLKLAYDSSDSWGGWIEPGNKKINFHLTGSLPKKSTSSTYTEAELVPKDFYMTPMVKLEKNTVIYRSLLNYHKEIPGYLFSGWKTSSGAPLIANDSLIVTKDIDLYASYTPKKIKSQVRVSWNDNSNSCGVRPSSITYGLYKKSGGTEKRVTSVSVTGSSTSNEWVSNSVEVEVGPDGDGNTEWYWKQDSSDFKYTVSDSKSLSKSSNPWDLKQTFTYSLNKLNLTVRKSWSDDNTKRPSSIAVKVKRKFGSSNDSTFSKDVTLSSSKSWQELINNLPLLVQNGTECTYYVEEPNTPSGYTSSISSGSLSGSTAKTQTITITNFQIKKANITIKGTWSDNSYSGRPSSIAYTLYRHSNGSKQRVSSGTLYSSSNYTAVLSQLDYVDGETFSVECTAPAGYTSTVSAGSMSGSYTKNQTFTITNTLPYQTYTVSKSWSESSVAGTSFRPSSISVVLYRTYNGVKSRVETVSLSSSNNWSTSKSVPMFKNNDGTTCSYSWEEVAVSGYKSSKTQSGYTTRFTNSIGSKTLYVSKTWDMSNSTSTSHPSSVQVKLYRTLDGVRSLVSTETLSTSLSKTVPVLYNKDGSECGYEWVEDVPSGYAVNYSVSGDTTTISNVAKSPDSVSIRLVSSFSPNFPEYLKNKGYTVNVQGDYDGTKSSVKSIDAYNNSYVYVSNDELKGLYGVPYPVQIYSTWDVTTTIPSSLSNLVDSTVVFDSVSDVTQSNGSVTRTYSYNINFRFKERPKLNIDVNVKWNLYSDLYKTNITPILYRRVKNSGSSWETVSNSVTADESTNWVASYKGLDRYNSNGAEYEFKVEASHPKSGSYYGDMAGSWFSNENNKIIDISVSSVSPLTAVDESTYSATCNVNINQNQCSGVTVKKEWDNIWDKSLVPSSVKANIYASWYGRSGNHKELFDTVILNEDNGFYAEVNNLPKYVYDGSNMEVQYVVEEVEDSDITEYFNPSVNTTSSYVDGVAYTNATITNTMKNKSTINVTLNKSWSMPYNTIEKPESVDVELYAVWQKGNREKVGTYTLSAGNNWSTVVSGLEIDWLHKKPVAPDGSGGDDRIIKYEAVEKDTSGYITDNFSSSVSPFSISYTGNVSITNTEKRMRKITIKYVWGDMDNRDGIRPSYTAETITDRNNRKYYVGTQAKDGYEASIYVPYYAYGTDANIFQVEYSEPDGYSLSGYWENEPGYGYEGDAVYIITAYHMPDRGKCTATFTKKWENTANGVDSNYTYPSTLPVVLMRSDVNGNTEVVKEVTVSKSGTNSYSTSVSNLIATDSGYNPYKYYFTDKSEIEGFTKSEETTKSGSTFSTVSTSSAKVLSVNAKVIWDDNDNKDKLRPSGSITVRNTGSVNLSLNSGNGWSATSEGNPSVSNRDLYSNFIISPSDIEGYVKDVDISKGSDTVDVTIKYTHAKKYISATVRKVWDDSSNSSNRPDYVDVDLYRKDNDEVIDSVTLSKNNSWSATIENLPSEGIDGEYYFVEAEMSKANGETGNFDYVTSYSYRTTDTECQTIITNKYVEPQKTEAKVKINWSDNNNSAGSRPSQVKVQLIKNGTDNVGDPIVLNASNSWSGSVSGLLAETDMGENSYEFVQLEVPFRYTESSNVSGTTTTITNTYSAPEYVSATVKKVWSDSSNKSAKVQLTRDGENVGNIITLSSSNNLTYTVNNLEKGYGDHEYSYSFKEVETPAGYTADVVTTKSGDNFNTTITNLYNVKKVNADVEVVWSDNDDVDGLRPDTVVVQLVRDGSVKIGNTVELSSENNFSWSTIDLPDEINGTKCNYSYQEVVPEGYTATYSTSGTKTTITNKHTVIPRTSVSVRKVWNDSNDIDKIRPSSVYVDLFCNEEHVDLVKLDSSNNWSATVSDLLTEVDGKTAVYTFEESEVTGYTASYSKSGSTTTITNKHTPIAKVSKTARVDWNDANNIDKVRPSSVDVNFLINGRVVKTVTLNSSNSWTHIESNLPETEADGTPIEYSYKYKTTPQYYTVLQNLQNEVATITYTHTPLQRVSPKVKVVFDDSNDVDGIRPTSVSVDFSKNGSRVKTLTLNSSNSWSSGESDLLVEELDGSTNEYSYEITTVPKGYSVRHSISGDTDTITLTHSLNARVSPEVRLVWDDGNNADNIRSSSVDVEFLNNGSVVKTVTLNNSNNWSHVESNLLTEDTNGNPIAYSYRVKTVPDYYTDNYSLSGDVTTVTMKHEPLERTDYTFKVIWNDGDDVDSIRPDEMLFQYDFNGVVESKQVNLSSSNNWMVTVKSVPVVDLDGNQVEAMGSFLTPQPEGYSLVKTTNGNIITYTFTHVPAERNDRSIKVTWDDSNDKDKVRPSSLDVRFLQGGTTVKTVTLNESNGWSHTESNLAMTTPSGAPIEYTYEVVSTPQYYTKAQTTSGSVDTVKMSHTTIKRGGLTVRVIWDDGNNADGLRPDEFYVRTNKYGGGVNEFVLNPSNGWSFTIENVEFEDLDGVPVVYSGSCCSDTTFLDYYTHSYGSDVRETAKDGVMEFRFSRTPIAKVNPSINIIWSDDNDSDGIRPSSLSANFLRNGTVLKTVALDSGNSWSASESDLPSSDVDGNVYSYSYELTSTPVGYTSSKTTSGSNTIYTLSHSLLERVNPSIKVTWDDANNQDKIRSESITAKFLKNGSEVKTVTLNEVNNWQHSESGLPTTEVDGTPITYTYEVADSEIPQYYTKTSEVSGSKTNVTITHLPSIVKDCKYVITWDDADNVDGIRPDSVRCHIDVVSEDGTKTPIQGYKYATAETSWECVFKDVVFRNIDGTKPKYEFVHKGFEGYTVTGETVDSDAEVPTSYLTYHHTPFKRSGKTVKFVWDDSENKDKIRPSSMDVELLRNGEVLKIVTLNGSNNWTHVEENLPGSTASGETLEYSYRTPDAPQYYTKAESVEGDITNVTFKHEPSIVKDMVGQIVWDDQDNVDGIRPDSVQLTLYIDDVATDRVAQLSEGNSWRYIFKDVTTREVDGTTHSILLGFKKTDGYTTTFENVDSGTVFTSTCTKHHVPFERLSKTVNVSWDDGNNKDQIRPSSIEVNFIKDGEVVKTVSLNELNNWSHTEENLPMTTATGETIEYSYEVVDKPSYYTVTKEVTGNTSIIKVSHTPVPRVNPTIQLTWDDGDDSDNIRPPYIEVDFKRNGEIVKTVRLDDSNDWTNTELDLPAETLDGDKIEYSYDIKSVPENYEATKEIVDGKEVLKLVHEASPRFNKVINVTWDDSNDMDKIRPAELRVSFNVDGSTQKTVVLNSSNNWSHIEPNLPERTPSGQLIDYEYKLVTVPDYYTQTTDSSSGIDEVTLSHTPLPRINRVINLTWDDEDDEDGIRPNNVKVRFKKNGELVKEVTLSESNHWSNTEEFLPSETLDGNPIKYEYELVSVPEDYDLSQSTEGTTDTMVLTHKAKRQLTVSVRVRKSDVYDAFGSPVFTVKLTGTLKRTGEKVTYYQMLTPSESDGDYYTATYTWGSLSTGTYVLSEMPVSRYSFDSIENVTGASVEGETVRVNFTSNAVTSANVTFVNALNGYEEYTHTDSGQAQLQ